MEQITSPNEKKFNWLLIVVFVIGVLIGFGICAFWNMSISLDTKNAVIVPQPNTKSTDSPQVNQTSALSTGDTDLESASNDLDAANPDTLDAGLAENDQDAANF